MIEQLIVEAAYGKPLSVEESLAILSREYQQYLIFDFWCSTVKTGWLMGWPERTFGAPLRRKIDDLIRENLEEALLSSCPKIRNIALQQVRNSNVI